MELKTSELLQKLMVASEESCKCEDENLLRMVKEVVGMKAKTDYVSVEEIAKLLRITTDFSRFISMRTTCKVLQDLGIIEKDVDVFNNEEFRNVFANMDMFK